MLGAIGVPGWWRRKASRGRALLLTLPAVAAGTAWGVLAASAAVRGLYGVPLAYPLLALALAVVVPLAVAALIGHLRSGRRDGPLGLPRDRGWATVRLASRAA